MLDPRWLDNLDAAAVASRDKDALAAIIAHPHFARLKRPWVETWRVDERDSAMLARTLQDSGRFFIGLWALYLHATPGGLTRGRLAEALKDSGMAGPGRVPATLMFLRFVGYIEPAPTAEDRRAQRYVPTARMLEAFGARFRRDLATFWPAEAAMLRLGPVADQPDVLGAYLAAQGEVIQRALVGYVPEGPSLDIFSQRYGGMAALAELMLAAPEEAAFPPTAAFPFSLADIARRSRISRAQVRSALTAGQKAGFLELQPDNRCRLLPALDAHMNMLLAGVLVVCAYASRRAAERLDAIDQARSA